VIRRRPLFLLLAAFAVIFACACRREASASKDEAPAFPVVTGASVDLLLTWIDEKGEFHVEQAIAKVPPSARDAVRVVDPARDGPPPEDVFVADLRNARPDGSYPVKTMKREAWEQIALDRRGGGKLAAAPAASTALGQQPRSTAAVNDVIIYGASWCGPCHQAAAFFKQRGVAFVEKDIEREPSAAREMQAKLARAGRSGGSIPVIDVRGKIFVGFDERAIDRALGTNL